MGASSRVIPWKAGQVTVTSSSLWHHRPHELSPAGGFPPLNVEDPAYAETLVPQGVPDPPRKPFPPRYPAAPRIMGTVGITGRTGTRRADPGRAERGPAPG